MGPMLPYLIMGGAQLGGGLLSGIGEGMIRAEELEWDREKFAKMLQQQKEELALSKRNTNLSALDSLAGMRQNAMSSSRGKMFNDMIMRRLGNGV